MCLLVRGVVVKVHAVASVREAEAEVGATLWDMTAKEQLLREAPQWSEALATAALRVAEAQTEIDSYFDAEAKMSAEEIKAREDRWALANARQAIREEPW
jgi:biopolymer transport protein ExbB/TolQ